MEFLDTNPIIRYITQDNLTMSHQAEQFFEQLESGAGVATTCEGVLVEAVQTLSSKALYNRPRAEIAEKLGVIIGLKGLKLSNKSLYLFALDLYAATAALDFVDALVVAHMQHRHISTVVSFDRDFDRAPGIRRRDP